MNGRRLAVSAALWGLFLGIGIAPALAQPAELVRGCLVESIAPLRLSELAQAISRCEQVIGDAASSRDLRGQALGQRGLLYAKRWSIVEVEQEISIESVPAPVKIEIESRAGKILKVESVTKNGTLSFFEARIRKRGKVSELQVSPEGKVISPKQ